MGLFDDPRALLPGLKPGAFRGVPFFIPDVSHEVGRRVVVTLFPGIDEASYDDLGRHDGPVHVRGLIVGDDYVQQALALQAALQTAGTGTLMHPWLGEMTVIVDAPAQIHFSVTELRVVRFDASFRPASARPAGFAASLPRLIGSVSALLAAATALAGAARRGPMAVSTVAAARTTILAGADRITALADASTGAADLAAPLAAARSRLEEVIDAVGEGEAVAGHAAALVALSTPVGALAAGRDAPAIGAHRPTAPMPTLDPRSGALLLVEIAAAFAEVPALGQSAAAARLVLQVAALARAVEAAAEIAYESRQDALTWRARLDAALTGAEAEAIRLSVVAPGQVAPVLGALQQLRADLAADLSEVIGRLPAVRIYRLPAVTSAWLLAQHFAGDDPARVVAMLHDIVARNRLPHPGAVPPEGLEVLA